MVAEDLPIARLVRGAEGNSALNVRERLRVLAGFEFTQTAESGRRSGTGSQFQESAERVPSGRIGTHAIFERPQEPPAVGPFGIELDRLRIERDRVRDIVLVPGGRGLRDQAIKSGALPASDPARHDQASQDSAQPRPSDSIYFTKP